MRITIITVGSHGDVQPYVALGLGLQAAGYDVCLATYTNFGTFVRSRGLDFFPLEGNSRQLLGSEGGQAWMEAGGNPLRSLRRLSRLTDPLMHRVLAGSWSACQDADAIVFSLLAWHVAHQVIEKLWLPFVPAFLQPTTPTSAFPNTLFPTSIRLGRLYNRLTYVVGEQVSWQLHRKAINDARRRVLNLPAMPVLAPFGRLRKPRHPILYGYSPAVLPKPADWGDWLHVTGYWFLDSPPEWKPPEDLMNFLESGPPPVYIGFGSATTRDPERMTELVLQALSRTRQRGILATGWGALWKDDLPDEVRAIESIPHDWLFPRMAAVVHHGGLGTTTASLRAGVPTVVVPFVGGQHFWGQRVFDLGVGPKPIPRRHLSVERLADAIRVAVSDKGMRARAADLGKRIQAENGVAQAVDLIHRHLSVPAALIAKVRGVYRGRGPSED